MTKGDQIDAIDEISLLLSYAEAVADVAGAYMETLDAGVGTALPTSIGAVSHLIALARKRVLDL